MSKGYLTSNLGQSLQGAKLQPLGSYPATVPPRFSSPHKHLLLANISRGGTAHPTTMEKPTAQWGPQPGRRGGGPPAYAVWREGYPCTWCRGHLIQCREGECQVHSAIGVGVPAYAMQLGESLHAQCKVWGGLPYSSCFKNWIWTMHKKAEIHFCMFKGMKIWENVCLSLYLHNRFLAWRVKFNLMK